MSFESNSMGTRFIGEIGRLRESLRKRDLQISVYDRTASSLTPNPYLTSRGVTSFEAYSTKKIQPRPEQTQSQARDGDVNLDHIVDVDDMITLDGDSEKTIKEELRRLSSLHLTAGHRIP